MRTRPVLIVLFDQVQSLDVTGPLEVFSGANQWLQSRGDQPAYEISTAGLDARPVRISSGLRLTPDVDLNRARTPDVLLAPGDEGAHAPEPGLVVWLREHAPRARQVVSVCTGAFLLAEADMLSGRRTTGHWLARDRLSELGRCRWGSGWSWTASTSPPPGSRPASTWP